MDEVKSVRVIIEDYGHPPAPVQYVKAAWPLPTIVGLNLIWYGAKDLRDIARFRRECAERAQEFEVRLAEMRERLR